MIFKFISFSLNCYKWFKILFLVFAIFSISCSSKKGQIVINILNAEDEFEEAKLLFDRKKYEMAAGAFERFTYNHAGSALVPDAIFFQGECQFLLQNYVEAISSFERVVVEYPSSSYADRAQYHLALSYFRQSPSWELEQELTEKAIEAFDVFLLKFPESSLVSEVKKKRNECEDKLARKEYESGRVYLALKFYDSAKFYFNSTIQKYPTSKWARFALFDIAECYFFQKDYRKANEYYQKILRITSDTEIIKKATKRLKKIEEYERQVEKG